MSELNHFAISAILKSEIVGQATFGHGQIASLADAQKYFDVTHGRGNVLSGELGSGSRADIEIVKRAFLSVREADGDRKSPDLYVADPRRNAKFIAMCRQLGLQDSDYALNKTLFHARKNGYLPGLNSVSTRTDYGDYAFASEFSATEIKYETGAAIDDILCHPILAARFDSMARKLAPGHSSFEYRWAILSIRKAGRRSEWRPEYQMPALTTGFKLLCDPLEQIPISSGVYLLREKNSPLYARATPNLRHSVEIHRHPEAFNAIANPLWRPDVDALTVSYAAVAEKRLLQPVEKKLVDDLKPVFNVSRMAA